LGCRFFAVGLILVLVLVLIHTLALLVRIGIQQ
jgi:hypothetical protein